MIAVPEFRDDFPRWQQLITPHWLHQMLTGAAPRAAPAKHWRVLEVGCDAHDAFLAGHIPGATYLDTYALEEAPYWNKVPDPVLLALLLKLGICHDTTVIVYGRNLSAAARAAHLLLYAGVSDVRFLDGGFHGWERADLPCVAGPAPQGLPATDFGTVFPACPHYLINLNQAQALSLQTDAALVSIRTWDEFTGKTSGYSYISAKGDIPGALWGRAGQGADVNDMSAFLDTRKRLRCARDVTDFWRLEGIHPGLQTAFYCGTGWRASLAFYYAWLMGWERISVFDGGWFEWSEKKTAAAHATKATLTDTPERKGQIDGHVWNPRKKDRNANHTSRAIF